jgi:Flp pilus assembly protein TadG
VASLNPFRRSASAKASAAKRRGRDDRGAELIELAFVLPILLLVLAAIVDFGFLFQRWESVTNAAREGARIATLPGYSGTAGGDVEARIRSYLTATGMPGGPAVIPPVVYTTETLPSGKTISTATVSVSYPADFSYLGPIAALIGGTSQGSIMLRAVSVMRMETAAGGS